MDAGQLLCWNGQLLELPSENTAEAFEAKASASWFQKLKASALASASWFGKSFDFSFGFVHSSLKFSCQWFVIMPTVLPDKSPGPAMWQQNAFYYIKLNYVFPKLLSEISMFFPLCSTPWPLDHKVCWKLFWNNYHLNFKIWFPDQFKNVLLGIGESNQQSYVYFPSVLTTELRTTDDVIEI